MTNNNSSGDKNPATLSESKSKKKLPVVDENTLTSQMMVDALTEHIKKEPDGVFLSTCGDILSSKGIPPTIARKITGNMTLLQWMTPQKCFRVYEVKREPDSNKPPIYKVAMVEDIPDSLVTKFRSILKQQLENDPDLTVYLSNVGVFFGQITGFSTEDLKKVLNTGTAYDRNSAF